jgi:hypothetical protein
MNQRRENVIRFSDIERRSRNADAVPRDPADTAVIVILPQVISRPIPPMTSPDGRFGLIPGSRSF